ncbi:MAG: DNA primase [Chitinophagales bacterium]|nr:DNA primase [Chitinophagales bacterium]
MISPASIQRLKDTVRIEDTVGLFLDLKRKGQDFWACCPFHGEKTPSFSVSPSRGIYKCFGCQRAGDSISFVMEHENLNYVESIRYLAEKFQIPLEEIHLENAEQIKEEQSIKAALYIVNDFANKYFQENLTQSSEGDIALRYFYERGLRLETIKAFELGYCLDTFEAFTQAAIKAKYNPEHLMTLGLTKETNGKKWDFFKGRIMFPIHHISGKVAGFGGRTINNNSQAAKYFNSPESPVYQKSAILYGLYQAKKSIAQLDECILVEGYLDVISMYQAGLTNVVANSGTALSIDQIKLIGRFTQNFILLYDSDAAGVKASLRSLDLILEQQYNVKIVHLPSGHDPDSFAKVHDYEFVKDYIHRNAQDIVTYKANLYAKSTLEDPLKRAEMANDIIYSITKVNDIIKRAAYIQQCSEITGIDEKTISSQVAKILTRRYQELKKGVKSSYVDTLEPIVPKTIDTQNSFQTFVKKTEEHLLRLLINKGIERYGEADNPFFQTLIAQFVIEEIKDYAFDFPAHQLIFNEILHHFHQHLIYPPEFYINHVDPIISEFAIKNSEIVQEPLMSWKNSKFNIKAPKFGANHTKEADDCVRNINVVQVRRLQMKILEMSQGEASKENAQVILAMQDAFIEERDKQRINDDLIFLK